VQNRYELPANIVGIFERVHHIRLLGKAQIRLGSISSQSRERRTTRGTQGFPPTQRVGVTASKGRQDEIEVKKSDKVSSLGKGGWDIGPNGAAHSTHRADGQAVVAESRVQ
jgi:hypothetical protein